MVFCGMVVEEIGGIRPGVFTLIALVGWRLESVSVRIP